MSTDGWPVASDAQGRAWAVHCYGMVGAARNKVHGGRAPGESTYADLPVADFGQVTTRRQIDMTVRDRAGVRASAEVDGRESHEGSG